MKKVMFFSIIAISAMMLSCNKQPAQTEEKEVISAEASQPLAALRTATDLAKYGYEAESATALIEAANIIASTPVSSLEAETENGTENPNENEKTEKVQFAPAQLLADARTLTQDANALALADKVEAKLSAQNDTARGAVNGPKYDYGTVYANSYVYYDIRFRAHEVAEVAVSGDGDTDLDLYVYDENGNLITSDTDYTDDCYVRFTPRWTGLFRLKIVNRGGVYNNYVLVTN